MYYTFSTIAPALGAAMALLAAFAEFIEGTVTLSTRPSTGPGAVVSETR